MKLGLVADTFSLETGTGIARYSQELLAGLSRLGLDTQPLCFPPPNLPFGAVMHHAIKMPYLISKQAGNFELIHATSPVCAFGFPLISRPKVVTYHDLTALLCKNTSVASYARLLAPLSYRIGKFADRVITDSSQTRAQMIVHLGISGDKITVVNLGVGDRFTPMKIENRDHYVIGYVGVLSRRKRVDYLLKAFRLLKERCSETPVRLIICGSKRFEYPALTRLAAELNVSSDVEFRGFVAEEALVKTYNSFDVFVLSSDREGFGLPILEVHFKPSPTTIDVPATTVDEYVESSGVAPGFVKIDAESSELEVLKGMRKTLANSRPIVTAEVGDMGIPGVPSSSEMVYFMLNQGYQAHEYRNQKIIPHQLKDRYAFDNILFLPDELRQI